MPVTVHIFGGRVGECIVLHMPSDSWGVIDCYADVRSGNPALEFLRARGVETLDFAAYTHPHFDHYTGILELVRAIPPRRFFRPVLTRAVDFTESILDDLRDPDQVPAEAPDQRKQEALSKLLAWEDNEGAAITQEMRVGTELRGRESGVEVVVMAPTVRAQRRIAVDKRNRRFNVISAAFVVRFRGATAILGGDLERDGWEQAFEAPDFRSDWARCNLLKVAHHGSETGSFPELWERIPEACLCVITNNSPHGLPNRSGLEPMGDRVAWVTHLRDARIGARFPTAAQARAGLLAQPVHSKGRQSSMRALGPASRIDVELHPEGCAVVQARGDAGRLDLSEF